MRKSFEIIKRWPTDRKLFKVDGKTIRWADGRIEWTVGNKFHREDGPARTWPDGRFAWYFDNKVHREGGPAIIRADGTKEWRIKGKFHRLDGPAIEYAERTEVLRISNTMNTPNYPDSVYGWFGTTAKWWVNGKFCNSFDDFLIKANLSTEQIAILKLQYA
jgi:hypothetical protein